jgi:hypothetical protein
MNMASVRPLPTSEQADLLAFCKSRFETVQALYSWAEGQQARQADAAALAAALAKDLAPLAASATLGADLDTIEARLRRGDAESTRHAIAGLATILRATEKDAGRRIRAGRPWAQQIFRLWPGWRAGLETLLLVILLAGTGTVVGLAWLYPDRVTRLADMSTLRDALERHRADNGQYPKSDKTSGDYDWTGIGWHGVDSNWLPDLVPKYLKALPRDPRNTDIAAANYIYRSNGTDFKLLTLLTPECSFTAWLNPKMGDPVRNTESYCQAYGYWTPGAVGW